MSARTRATAAAVPRFGDAGLAAAFRAVLDGAGYEPEATTALLGDTPLERWELPLHLRRVPEEGRLPTLVRLFLLGVPVSPQAAAEAFAPLSLADAAALGVVSVDEQVEPLVRILVHDTILVASDGEPTGDAAHDHVSGVSPSTRSCLALTHRAPVERALDVGTGCGAQALAMAAHCDDVVATDVNPRALAFAELNAALNGLTGLELREGDLLDPVAGERFGLVACNAPYVISPESRFAFRDDGRPGDGTSEALVRGVPALLEEGGTATLVVSWLGGDEDDWAARPRDWLAGSGCDAWVLGGPTLDPLAHAAKWTTILARDQEAYGHALDEWSAYIRELGASRVTEGVLILRRRAGGTPWFRADRIPRGAPRNAGDQLERVLAARDAGPDAPARLADEARIVRGPGADGEVRLALTDGLLFEAEIDAGLADALLALDGTAPLADTDAARELGETGFLDVRP